MADISSQLVLIAISCAFTIFSLTLGKLFSCANSYSVKWAFVSGCIGALCTLLYVADNLSDIIQDPSQLISNPVIIVDLFMSMFAVVSLFHISVPAKYFDDEEWDNYFYETYDLPKPNLVLHTPVDELEEDSFTGDEIDEAPYIPSSATITSNNSEVYKPSQPVVPSYIANPANYNPAPTIPVYPVYPPVQQPAYYPAYPAYPPVYPTYPNMQSPQAPVGYMPYTQSNVSPTNPYDTAAMQYQYERRRAELQNRELEQLTGQVDESLAQMDNSVRTAQPPVNQYVAAAPDEAVRERTKMTLGQVLRPASGYMQPGESLTDHLARINREAGQQEQPYDDSEEEYTYEYYYPTSDQFSNTSNRFNPYRRNNGGGSQ